MTVIVIGAGVIGCAIAYELASRGAEVRILEKRQVGQGATRASAGVLCPHIEGHAAPLLQLGARSLTMYDTFVARASTDSGEPVDYRRTGTLEIAMHDEEAERLRGIAARHRTAAWSTDSWNRPRRWSWNLNCQQASRAPCSCRSTGTSAWRP